MNKTAIITGITGQDGSYLAEYLLGIGYNVVGIKRRTSTNNQQNIEHIKDPNFSIIEGDITDMASMSGIIADYSPDEFYNLAAQSHVHTSFSQPYYTFQADAIGVLNILESIRQFSPSTKLYQAGTSEQFGKNFTAEYDRGSVQLEFFEKKYQDENTPFAPQSPYAVAKVAAHHLVRLYREAYNVFGCVGILFNHESPRRGELFVTRKITKYIAALNKHLSTNQSGDFPRLKLGNIDSYRDWGFAGDYVRGMHLMMQHNKADDYVLATGETHSVKDFLKEAFKYIGQEYYNWVEIDPALYRPAEVDYLLGSSNKARHELWWKPTVDFTSLVKMMVEHDIQKA